MEGEYCLKLSRKDFVSEKQSLTAITMESAGFIYDFK